MNRRGFTLVELLATLVVLGIVMGITLISVNGGFSKAKNNTEEVFIDTIMDAMEIYLDSDARNLIYDIDTGCTIKKAHGEVKVYKAEEDITMNNVINSDYRPLAESDLKNPANKSVECATGRQIPITIYRDEDFVYYYRINKDTIKCLLDTDGYITTLPNACAGIE